MVQWEYQIVELPSSSGLIGGNHMAPEEEKLNAMGKEGWELVTGLPVKDDEITPQKSACPTTLVFKRRIDN